MQALPARPDQVATKEPNTNRAKAVIWGIGIIVALSLFAAAVNGGGSTSSSSTNPIGSFDSILTPEMVVDMAENAQPNIVTTFCTGYDVLGPSGSYAVFADAYNSSSNGSGPSAAAVFDEYLSRC